MGGYFGEAMPSVENLPNLVIKEENCRDMDKLEACVVRELETCKESTPANLVEALFRFVRKETPCNKYSKKTAAAPNGGDFTKMSFNVLLGTWVMAAAAKFLLSLQ